MRPNWSDYITQWARTIVIAILLWSIAQSLSQIAYVAVNWWWAEYYIEDTRGPEPEVRRDI